MEHLSRMEQTNVVTHIAHVSLQGVAHFENARKVVQELRNPHTGQKVGVAINEVKDDTMHMVSLCLTTHC